MFLPSGTMCNVVAILTHCRSGEEVIAHQTAHILTSEGGAHAAFSGVQIQPLPGPRGMFTAEQVRAAIRPRTRYAPPQRLLEVEQTANIGGGAIWPLAQLNEVAAVARGEGWATHMDGARLHERLRRRRHRGAGDGRLLRFRLGRFHQGPRRAARRRARRQCRVHR